MTTIFILFLVITAIVLEIDYWFLRSDGESKDLYRRMWILHPVNAFLILMPVYFGYAIASPLVLTVSLKTGLRIRWIHSILLAVCISAICIGTVFLLLSYLGSIGYPESTSIHSLM